MNSTSIEWRIYYDDDSTFDNTQGEPWEAPGRGIICIVQIDPSPAMESVNTQILAGHPFYWFSRAWGYWLHSDIHGVVDQFTGDRSDSVCALKMGKWLDYESYELIMEKAKSDTDFPMKSGISKVEQRHRG